MVISMNTPDDAAASAFRIDFSRLFEGWFREQNCAIACTTYQAGKVFLLGKG